MLLRRRMMMEGNKEDSDVLEGIVRWWKYENYNSDKKTWIDVNGNELTFSDSSCYDEEKMIHPGKYITIDVAERLGIISEFTFEAVVRLNGTGNSLRHGNGMWSNDINLTQNSLIVNGTSYSYGSHYPYVGKICCFYIAADVKNAEYRVYINGKDVLNLREISGFVLNNQYAFMLFNQNNEDVGEIKIYNRKLNENEILHNFNSLTSKYIFS